MGHERPRPSFEARKSAHLRMTAVSAADADGCTSDCVIIALRTK